MAEQLLQMDLTGGRRQQIVTANHLRHPLGCVVDDDGKVVRGDTVVAPQDHVVDHTGDSAVHTIVELDLVSIRAQSQRRRAPVDPTGGEVAHGEFSTGSRVRPGRSVGCVRSGFDVVADLSASAEALVDEVASGKLCDRCFVSFEPLALADHFTVPVDPEHLEITELRHLELLAGLVKIEVFHPDDEIVATRPGGQPGSRRCSEVTEVQITRRRRREASGHADSVAQHEPDATRPNDDPLCDPFGGRRHAGGNIFYSRAMVCAGCGIDVAEHQKFCHECGAALTTPTIDEASSDQPATEPIEVTEPIEATEPVEVTEPVGLTAPTAAMLQPTTQLEVFAPPVTAEMPALFDGQDDLAEYPTPRDPFQVRVVFLLAMFGAAAMLMTIVADVIDIRTTRPASGITTGPQTLEQLGSNLGLAGFVGTAVMVLGGLFACFGLRWGAGLAGGAGLALAGWAGLSIGLAEFPIAVAESITRTSSVQFTLSVTRDLGWWLIVGVGVVGLIVFLASLRSIGSGGRPALNPLVAAGAAVAMVVLAFGPLVPMNDAVFADNFRSVDPTRDLPAAFFAGRLGQVGLILLAGVVGMLIVRSYGLGLAAGGVSVSLWLWISSLGEIGSRPVGIADRNPGADSTVPHAVTTVGMVSALALLLIAAGFATYRLNRSRPS